MDGVVVLIKAKGKYLMIKQGKEPFRGMWGPVHGGMEPGETEEEAVTRETLEEVGLKVRPIRRVATTPADYKVKDLHWWVAECESGTIKIDKSEISDFGYFSLGEISELQLLPQAKAFFKEYSKQL